MHQPFRVDPADPFVAAFRREARRVSGSDLPLSGIQLASDINHVVELTGIPTVLHGPHEFNNPAVTGKDWLGQAVVADINPVFNFEYLSFIFNHFIEDGSAYSWLLRFKDQDTETRFQEGLMQALWEQLNELKWNKTKDDEREYVLEAFNDLTMEDTVPEEEEPEEGEGSDDGQQSEH
jgi:hypothetical protein